MRMLPLFIRLKSRKEMQVSRDFKLTEEEINKAIMRSPYALPNSPGQAGLNASQIKKYFYDFIRSLALSLNVHFDDINLSIGELGEVIEKINERLGEMESNDEGADNATVTEGMLSEHNESADAHKDIRDEIDIARSISTRALNIAQGKNRIHAFVSLEKMFEFIDIHRYYEDYGNSDFESIDEGDIFIIAQKGVPELAVLRLSRYEDEITQDFGADDIAATEFKAGGVYYYTKKDITLVGMEGGSDTSGITDVSQVEEKIALHNEDTSAHSDLREQLTLHNADTGAHTDLREQIALKQNKLSAGDNIEISEDGVISAALDAAGKLDKSTEATERAQAYIKDTDGTQALIDIISNSSAAQDLLVTESYMSSQFYELSNYVEGAFLKSDAASTSLSQAYVKNADGTQTMVDLCVGLKPDSIVIRDANGAICVDNATYATDAVPKHYVDGLINDLRTEIEARLDSIIAQQEALTGGDSV